MQLSTPARPTPLRARLAVAAGALLAVGLPAAAHAEAGAATWQVEASTLFYGEKSRTNVAEPFLRVTRLFPNGQSLSAKLGFDTITGSSPSGASPTGTVQTTTSASGRVSSIPAGSVPLKSFKDTRGSFDLDWTNPFTRHLTYTLGGHFSREKDYQSTGANARLSLECMQKLTTITVGGGVNRDRLFPVGGTPVGLSPVVIVTNPGHGHEDDDKLAAATGAGSEGKKVDNWLAGVSRVLTRRWMVSANVSRTYERGYLTEPYKVISILDSVSGVPRSEVTEKRPATRQRFDLMTNSVYHLSEDVVYLSHRYYKDDWGIRSNTFDLKYRHELGDNYYVQPHVRYYAQTRADFFTFGFRANTPLPAYASSDYRLGPLKSVTVGATLGIPLSSLPGQITVRAEYLRQFGDGHPADAIGTQAQFDLMPAVDITSLLVGYSVEF